MDNGYEEIGAAEAAVVSIPFVKFETLGQEFKGKYLGSDEVKGKFGPQTAYKFIAPDPRNPGSAIELYVSGNPDLIKRMSAARVGDFLVIKWADNKDVGQPSPMKVFQVGRMKPGTQAPATAPGTNAAPF